MNIVKRFLYKTTGYELVLQIAALEKENGELREALFIAGKALEHCKHRPHEHNPPSNFIVTRCDVIDRAIEELAALLKAKP